MDVVRMLNGQVASCRLSDVDKTTRIIESSSRGRGEFCGAFSSPQEREDEEDGRVVIGGPGGLVMKDKAYQICREYLSGTWKKIDSRDMVFKSISGGMSNLLYYCSLPETHTPLASPTSEPSQVLLRMYGQLHDGEKPESTITESVIFMMLSERKLGPKLYGIFPGGRLEEYIPARALTCDELHDPMISAIIARKLAGVHTLQVPINKEPSWLFHEMNKWLSYIRENIDLSSIDEDKRSLAEQLLAIDFEGEIRWLRSFLPKTKSPVVFCHNDLQEGNILFPDGSREAAENRLVFIDFEYSSYNYRGFDIANHFCEWSFDYSPSEWPHFSYKYEDHPSKDRQVDFIKAYLSALRDKPASASTSTSSSSASGSFKKRHLMASEHQILQEVTAFTPSCHLLWALWSVYNAHTSKIAFGYWEHGLARMDAYYKWKNHCLKPHVMDPPLNGSS